MMATLRCDHPDIREFIAAKQQQGQLSHFNLSIQVTDEFMMAVRSDGEWPLVYPVGVLSGDGETVLREWPGYTRAVPCAVIRRIRARQLWDRILRATYDYSEPGVLFIDPHQSAKQSMVPRANYRHESMWRDSVAAIWGLRPRLAEPTMLRAVALHAESLCRF
jgi:ribonucleotide reductase alpha subunit